MEVNHFTFRVLCGAILYVFIATIAIAQEDHIQENLSSILIGSQQQEHDIDSKVKVKLNALFSGVLPYNPPDSDKIESSINKMIQSKAESVKDEQEGVIETVSDSKGVLISSQAKKLTDVQDAKTDGSESEGPVDQIDEVVEDQPVDEVAVAKDDVIEIQDVEPTVIEEILEEDRTVKRNAVLISKEEDPFIQNEANDQLEAFVLDDPTQSQLILNSVNDTKLPEESNTESVAESQSVLILKDDFTIDNEQPVKDDEIQILFK